MVRNQQKHNLEKDTNDKKYNYADKAAGRKPHKELTIALGIFCHIWSISPTIR